jgi:nucleoid-associated protein YgaU
MRKSLLALPLLVSAGLAHGQGQPGDAIATIKLSPQVRSSPVTEAIPGIALKSINSFLLSNRIVDKTEDFTKAPYVVAGDSERVLSGAGDRIFVRGQFDPAQPVYGIFRQGKVYTDPQSKEILGINADDIGGGEVVAIEGDVATLELQRTTQEVRLGDRLFSGEERSIKSTFTPSAPNTGINGLIIDVPRGVTQIGELDVVTLNKGKRDGLVEGNVLAVMKTGETVRDRMTGQPLKIPDERAGLLMVFRTYDKLSYGLVLNASRSLAVMDKVRNP